MITPRTTRVTAMKLAGVLLLGLVVAPLASLGQSADSSANSPRVRVHTTAGNFVIELNRERAPLTVETFLGYVKQGFYNGTDLPPRDPGLHRASGRLHGRLQAEARERQRRQRVRQRPQQPARYGRLRTHERPAFGHEPVLHQHGRQRGSEPAADSLGVRGVRESGRRQGQGRRDARRRRDRPSPDRRRRSVRQERAQSSR